MKPTTGPSRRTFLSATALGAAAVSAPIGLARAQEGGGLPQGAVVVFQGDSITDAGRNRQAQDQPNHPAAMGDGYPFLIASYLLAVRPTLGLKFYNRGISGNKVPDLDARWQPDAIALQPDVLSILIGVNDIWHKLNGKYDGTVEQYEQQYANLLKRTKESLPNTRIVVCEPFVLRCGAVNEKWFPEFDQRRAAAKRQAQSAGAVFLPFQTMFDEAVTRGTDPAHWAADGVHPSMAGHCAMAMKWVETVSG
jgi:lysophospholipase L1-like esterase